ncbi:MAG: AMP-binding protein [Spirochaetota bacterium]
MPEKPWIAYYGEIPASISYPDTTLFELFERSVLDHPDSCAVDYVGERITYDDLYKLVDSAARGLTVVGVRAGDRIACLMPNTPHVLVLLYAANRIGALFTVFNADASAPELSTKLGKLEPQWVVCSSEHADGLVRLAAAGPIRGVVVASVNDFGSRTRLRALARLRSRYGLGKEGIRGIASYPRDGETVSESPPVFSWRSFLEFGTDVALPPHREVHLPDDPAVVLFTGGTTHDALAAVHADRQLTAVALQTHVQGPLLEGQSVLSVVPFSHGYGIAGAGHAALTAGGTTIVVPHWTPRSLARLIRRSRPEYLIGVPSVYAELVLDRVFRRARHRSLMGAFCGGDRLPRSVRDLFEKIVRRRGGAITIREGYGLTETVTACATMPESDARAGSVGVPYPDTLIAIARPLDVADGAGYRALIEDAPPAWLGPDAIGEILVSGPTVMREYWRDGEASARVFHADESDRVWLRTGDAGRMDADGFLYFVERLGRGFRSGGIEVHPGLTELALNEHLEVLEACVTVNGPGAEPRLTAHVAPLDEDRDETWLEAHLRESLQTLHEAQRPTRYVFHARLPRTTAGVTDHRRLALEPHPPNE